MHTNTHTHVNLKMSVMLQRGFKAFSLCDKRSTPPLQPLAKSLPPILTDVLSPFLKLINMKLKVGFFLFPYDSYCTSLLANFILPKLDIMNLPHIVSWVQTNLE